MHDKSAKIALVILVIRVQPHPQFLKWYKKLSWLFGSHDNPLQFERKWVFVSLLLVFKMLKGSTVRDHICLKFELIQDITHVLITCKFKEDQINSN